MKLWSGNSIVFVFVLLSSVRPPRGSCHMLPVAFGDRPPSPQISHALFARCWSSRRIERWARTGQPCVCTAIWCAHRGSLGRISAETRQYGLLDGPHTPNPPASIAFGAEYDQQSRLRTRTRRPRLASFPTARCVPKATHSSFFLLLSSQVGTTHAASIRPNNLIGFRTFSFSCGRPPQRPPMALMAAPSNQRPMNGRPIVESLKARQPVRLSACPRLLDRQHLAAPSGDRTEHILRPN